MFRFCKSAVATTQLKMLCAYNVFVTFHLCAHSLNGVSWVDNKGGDKNTGIKDKNLSVPRKGFGRKIDWKSVCTAMYSQYLLSLVLTPTTTGILTKNNSLLKKEKGVNTFLCVILAVQMFVLLNVVQLYFSAK